MGGNSGHEADTHDTTQSGSIGGLCADGLGDVYATYRLCGDFLTAPRGRNDLQAEHERNKEAPP
jgi:hypothetical protein